MLRIFIVVFCLFLGGCGGTVETFKSSQVPIEFKDKQLYIVPFETVMVPQEVSADLFDQFVDQLNREGTERGIEFIILKQGLAEIDPDWLADKNYLRGELFAYVEEVGATMTDIKARSRIRLYRSGQAAPALQIAFPTEVFYQNDYSSLSAERRKLAEQVARNLADRFLSTLVVHK